MAPPSAGLLSTIEPEELLAVSGGAFEFVGKLFRGIFGTAKTPAADFVWDAEHEKGRWTTGDIARIGLKNLRKLEKRGKLPWEPGGKWR
jgi:hypothetical protein